MTSEHDVELARDLNDAQAGHVEAQFFLAFRYEHGTGGFDQDAHQAAHWYRECAERSAPDCQYRLGKMYEEGRGVPRDLDLAANWYEKAASQGIRAAQTALGNVYRRGAGRPVDYTRAINLYRLAADRDHHEAQYWLGLMHELGFGLAPDAAFAMDWNQKARVVSSSEPCPISPCCIGKDKVLSLIPQK